MHASHPVYSDKVLVETASCNLHNVRLRGRWSMYVKVHGGHKRPTSWSSGDCVSVMMHAVTVRPQSHTVTERPRNMRAGSARAYRAHTRTPP
eukprot:1678938-Prymnesium_polylepis.1